MGSGLVRWWRRKTLIADLSCIIFRPQKTKGPDGDPVQFRLLIHYTSVVYSFRTCVRKAAHCKGLIAGGLENILGAPKNTGPGSRVRPIREIRLGQVLVRGVWMAHATEKISQHRHAVLGEGIQTRRR